MKQKNFISRIRYKLLPATVALLALVILAGCQATPQYAQEKGEKVLFETVKQGQLGFAFKGADRSEFKVFRTEKEWNEFWGRATDVDITSRHYVDPMEAEQPFIDPDPYSEQLSRIAGSASYTDFEMLVGAFLFSGSGYEVTITDVRKTDDKIVVEVEGETFDDDRPGITAPYHVVKLKRSELPVEFKFVDKR